MVKNKEISYMMVLYVLTCTLVLAVCFMQSSLVAFSKNIWILYLIPFVEMLFHSDMMIDRLWEC